MFNKNFILQYKYSLVLGASGLVLLVLAVIFSFLNSNLFSKQAVEPAFSVLNGNQGLSESDSGTRIFVDIEGAVVKPGVYEMKDTDRVDDLLEAAGGISENADLEFMTKTVNKAQVLSDGMKIYILFKSDDSSPVKGVYSDEKTSLININTASSSELESLPGIGEKTAEKIIDARPYADTHDLVSKKIVTESVFEKIKDKISVY